MKKHNKIWMAGFTCLSCGKGHYKGYGPYPEKKTLPCEKCGDVRPASMTSEEFMKVVETRDALLHEMKSIINQDHEE